MTLLKKFSGIMANPTAYRLWQMPFAEKKFRPIRQHNDFSKVHRVLDVGCGPGTNSVFFEDKDYVGMDINADYIQQAKRRFGDRFYVGDVCTYQAKPDERFDFILLNSLLHHIDDEHTDRILKQLSGQLNPNGHIHILDLVLPEKSSVARTLAKSDRGDHPRPLDRWNKIFSRYFDPVVFEPYAVGLAGLPMWQMVYFKGSARPQQQVSVATEELATAGEPCSVR